LIVGGGSVIMAISLGVNSLLLRKRKGVIIYYEKNIFN